MQKEAAHTISFAALGTRWWIELFDKVQNVDSLFIEIKDMIDTFERDYSRFQSDSFVSRVNKERELTCVSSEFITLLECGRQWHKHSSGVFNILLGNILEADGYGNFKGDVDTTCIANPQTDLILREDHILLSAGLIDLGGIGKGYLIDKIADHLSEHTASRYLINGGGDMRITMRETAPIELYLEDPRHNSVYIAKIEIIDGAFAASSPHKRTWQNKDTLKKHTHLTNPTDRETTQTPSFVVAPSATDADVLATTLSINAPSASLLTLIEERSIGYALEKEPGTLTWNHYFPSLLQV